MARARLTLCRAYRRERAQERRNRAHPDVLAVAAVSASPIGAAPIAAIEIALSHARAGRPVFPCDPRDKQPLTPHGFRDATTDEPTIRRWWTRHPLAMVGMPTGGVSGLVVLDMDRDGRKDGVAAVAALGELPPTLAQSTPRGGRHAFFAFDPARPMRCTASKIAPGVDTRGDGGYVILAGSARDDGALYAWETAADHPVAPIPDWLWSVYQRATVRPDPPAQGPRPVSRSALPAGREPYVQAALEDELTNVAGAPSGGRNAALNRAAFSLGQFIASGHLGEDEVRDASWRLPRIAGWSLMTANAQLLRRSAAALRREVEAAGASYPRSWRRDDCPSVERCRRAGPTSARAATPTRRPVTRRPVTRRPVTRRPVTRRPVTRRPRRPSG